ncbi:MAG: SIMPL domain-containing protein [Burkholderiaceae bacterium]|nr:SIMPL domain-containing protein [Pseudomonadota bacterium]MBS0598114.1 SIMPL domain-containing protein [Pseudomonadota bacterium]MCP5219686.1 SIMPL domain-containing protein [Burkholderiaceae bacterium]
MLLNTSVALAIGLGWTLAQAAGTQNVAAATAAGPANVLQLSASGQAEAPQDLLTLTLATTREGTDAAAVQGELSQAVDQALAVLRKDVQAGQMEVHTGEFSVLPRYDREGRINGWQGRASVVLQGRDFARITQAAARASAMSVAGMGFGLSREQRERLEGQAQAQAIARFRAKAGEIARAFGLGDYTLREVSVSSDEQGDAPRPYGLNRMAMAAAAPVAPPVEPGRGIVHVTVSGSIQAR